jgi:hypothetical protein
MWMAINLLRRFLAALIGRTRARAPRGNGRRADTWER